MMGEYDVLISLISTVGFPIAAFLLLYVDLRRLINKQYETMSRLTYLIEQHIKGVEFKLIGLTKQNGN